MQFGGIGYAIGPSKLDKQVERRGKLAATFGESGELSGRWFKLYTNSSLYKCIITYRKDIGKRNAGIAPPSLNVLFQDPQAGTPGAARLLAVG